MPDALIKATKQESPDVVLLSVSDSIRSKLYAEGLIAANEPPQKETDDVGNPVQIDAKIRIDSVLKIRHAITFAFQNNCGAVPMGSLTSGNKSFVVEEEREKSNLDACLGLGVSAFGKLREYFEENMMIDGVNYKVVEMPGSQVRILESPEPKNYPHKVEVWGGVTPANVDEILKSHFGPGHTIFLDLTTRDSAQIAAVIATGGQGPVRANAAFNLDQVLIVDGEGQEQLLVGEEAKKQVGLSGTAGTIAEARFNVVRELPNQFAFFVPLKGSLKQGLLERYPEVLALLHRYTRSDETIKDMLVPESGLKTMIKGLEIITRTGMERTLKSTAVSEEGRALAQKLFQQMDQEGCEVGLMINGVSQFEDSDEIFSELMQMLNLSEEDFLNPELGITTDGTFYPEKEMKKVRSAREGVAVAARANSKKGFSLSFDLNARLTSIDPAINKLAYYEIWALHFDYIQSIENYVEQRRFKRIRVVYDLYGHNHPGSQYEGGGVDPHNRISVIILGKSGEELEFESEEDLELILSQDSELREEYEDMIGFLKKAQSELYRKFIALHGKYGIKIPPGEKGILFNKIYLEWLKKTQPVEYADMKVYIQKYGGRTLGFRALSRMD